MNLGTFSKGASLMRIILFLAAFIFLLIPATASAGEPVFCGVPKDVNISTEATPFCDIHARRILYRREAIKLKGQMQERAKNFAAPRKAAYEQYLRDLEAVDRERSSSAFDDTEAFMQAKEEELVELDESPVEGAILEEVDELEELDSETFVDQDNSTDAMNKAPTGSLKSWKMIPKPAKSQL